MARNQDRREAARLSALDALKSTGFWSAIGAIVGFVATIAGVTLFLTIDELRNFSITVLIIGLSLLFLALVLSPRAVAIFMAGRQGRYGTNVAIMTVAFFVIVILINFLLYRTPGRIDLTATRVFSLAQQTEQVLDTLDTPVRANAFFVPSNTSTAIARQQAEDLLNEFARRSGSFTYRFVDPELDRSVAVQYDVDDYPVIVFEDLETTAQQSVFSITEQDFVTGILVATGVSQKIVYHLTGHDEASITRDLATGGTDDEGFDFAIQGMQRDNYLVLPLNLKQDVSVPENAAVLVLPGPSRNLDAAESQAISDYLASGGKLLMLLDPNAPDSYRELLAPWGLRVGRDPVADLISNVAETKSPMIQRTNAQFGLGSVTGVPIADKLNVVFFTDATAVLPSIPQEDMSAFGMSYATLARTTPASWLETHPETVNFDPGEDVQGPLDVAAVIQTAASLEGQLITAENENTRAKIVAIGDSDFARNKFFFSNDNADLLLNSVNWLAEDYELISIRVKTVPFRQLVLNSRERDFMKWSSWFFPPTLMLAIALFVWWRRR